MHGSIVRDMHAMYWTRQAREIQTLYFTLEAIKFEPWCFARSVLWALSACGETHAHTYCSLVVRAGWRNYIAYIASIKRCNARNPVYSLCYS